ncbi:L-lactate dehydrogenase complex protein LldG [Hoeflea halophila]|uniref:L-lactate dehydrogenase complex protein LldG n=1 Tax=Hoeflea halophila TaxID=714899 RepID=A0A286IE82_9HYPH|nr:LUD domain-containing protein [Hoeflea halophila]SOE18382.1 L-lactate dehydrogenase complex protein LldG [Hoeflea halophila]
MSARDSILGKIRASMGSPASNDDRRRTVADRLGSAPAGIIPERAKLAEAERIELFCAMAEQFGATLARVGSYGEVAGEVSGYLRDRNLPATIRIGADKRLKAAGWETEKNLELRHGPSDGSDMTGVSHATAGIAETGTVAMMSGQDNPTTINFLPEHHIVVIKAGDIKGDMESVWAMVREKQGKGEMPRALNLITGPSRSGDIEQTILLGAHGPRALHVIVVD